MKILHGFSAFALIIISNMAIATCEKNVDNIETYYINGMFTDYSDFISNRDAIDRFIQENLKDQGFTNPVAGTHNDSEFVLTQVLEVLRQKIEDGESSEAIMEFMNGDDRYLDALTDRQQVEAFLRDINEYYTLSIDDADQQEANAGVRSLLDTCSRVIVITHSQGNFYGNRVLSNLYSSYSFPNGYSLSRHPMLGNLQIASPVDIPGGAISAIYPEIIGHLTNDNDLIMALVRGTMGSTDSNYAAEFNPNDWTGHGLEESYLNRAGQGAEISSQLAYIASNLTPYPMHEQRLVVSSALSGYGHSSINNLLDIKFLDGSVYRYSDVSAGTAAGLDSGAAGSYFNSSIRGKYLYEKIE